MVYNARNQTYRIVLFFIWIMISGIYITACTPIFPQNNFHISKLGNKNQGQEVSYEICEEKNMPHRLQKIIEDRKNRPGTFAYKNSKYTPDNDTFDIGRTCYKAINNFHTGKAPLDCGLTSESDNGNGSLMRIASLPLYVFQKFGSRYCQMLWIEVWIGKGLSDFLQHTIFKFHVLGHKVKLFKAFQSSPTFFCLPTEFKSHGFCGLCRSVALC